MHQKTPRSWSDGKIGRGWKNPGLFDTYGICETWRGSYLSKTIMVSNLMWHIMQERGNPKAKEEECSFFEPDTENTYIQTCFGRMKEEYGWKYSLDNDFNYEGGLTPKMSMPWTKRVKDWPELGTENTCSRFRLGIYERARACEVKRRGEQVVPTKNTTLVWEHFFWLSWE